jgi:hypothetical protein
MLPKIHFPISELTIPTTKEVLQVRPFLVKEEKILLMAKSAAEVDGANPRKELLKAVQQVVNNCVLAKDFDVEKLALVDLEWLFLRLRSISVDNVVKVAYKDPEDEKVYDFEIAIDKIEVNGVDSCPKVLEVDDKTKLGLRYPRAELFLNAEDALSAEAEFDKLLLHTLDWVSVGGKVSELAKASEAELQEFVDTIPVKVLEDIKKFWAAVPTIKHEISYKNSKGTERKIVLQTLEDFFSF